MNASFGKVLWKEKKACVFAVCLRATVGRLTPALKRCNSIPLAEISWNFYTKSFPDFSLKYCDLNITRIRIPGIPWNSGLNLLWNEKRGAKFRKNNRELACYFLRIRRISKSTGSKKKNAKAYKTMFRYPQHQHPASQAAACHAEPFHMAEASWPLVVRTASSLQTDKR